MCATCPVPHLQAMAASAAARLASQTPMPSKLLIDLRIGHPATANLPHLALAAACRRAAARIDSSVAAASAEKSAARAHKHAAPASTASTTSEPFELNYADNSGTPRFLRELRRWLAASYGSHVHPDSLVTTNGVSHGIDLVCSALSNPGDLVMIEEPCYFLAKHIFRGHHLRLAAAPMDVVGIDTATLADELASGAREVPRLVCVAANPSPLLRTCMLLPLSPLHTRNAS
jgi:DNA-binding transcriptional MocR family regulator